MLISLDESACIIVYYKLYIGHRHRTNRLLMIFSFFSFTCDAKNFHYTLLFKSHWSCYYFTHDIVTGWENTFLPCVMLHIIILTTHVFNSIEACMSTINTRYMLTILEQKYENFNSSIKFVFISFPFDI